MSVNAITIDPSTVAQNPATPETGPNFPALLDDYNQAVTAFNNLNANLEKLEKNPTGPNAQKEKAHIETDLKTILQLCNPENLSGFYAAAGHNKVVKSALNNLVSVLLTMGLDAKTGHYSAMESEIPALENALSVLREAIL
jgi:hypothetical protein